MSAISAGSGLLTCDLLSSWPVWAHPGLSRCSAGCSSACCCLLRVVSETARLAQPERDGWSVLQDSQVGPGAASCFIAQPVVLAGG